MVIAPEYDGAVIRTGDAASMAATAQRLIVGGCCFVNELKQHQHQVRDNYNQSKNLLSLAEARTRKVQLQYSPKKPSRMGVGILRITVEQARRLINWRAFFAAWGLDASFADIADIHGCDCCRAAWLAAKPQAASAQAAQAMQLFKDANRALDKFERYHNESLRAIYGLWQANADGDDIVFTYMARTHNPITNFVYSGINWHRADNSWNRVMADGSP